MAAGSQYRWAQKRCALGSPSPRLHIRLTVHFNSTLQLFIVDMACSLVDRRRVYLACKAIFTGNNAQLRKQKKIRELVERRRTSLGPLIGDFGIQGVVDILRGLLDDRIFQSELNAKVEFPELFLSSPERDIQRAESENHAAQSAAEALEEIASLDQFDNELDQEDDDQHSQRLFEPGEVAPGKTALFNIEICQ